MRIFITVSINYMVISSHSIEIIPILYYIIPTMYYLMLIERIGCIISSNAFYYKYNKRQIINKSILSIFNMLLVALMRLTAITAYSNGIRAPLFRKYSVKNNYYTKKQQPLVYTHVKKLIWLKLY